MPGSHNIRIRKGEPFSFRVLQWKDPDGNVVDPTLYFWQLRGGDGSQLSIDGVVSAGHVAFSLPVAQTSALRFSRATYVVEATAYGGGDPNRVLSGRVDVDADPVAT